MGHFAVLFGLTFGLVGLAPPLLRGDFCIVSIPEAGRGDRSMKRTTTLLSVLLVSAVVPLMCGHGAEPKKVGEIMRLKLKHTQQVLEGLADKDFKQIGKNADELLLLTKDEEWKILGTPDYMNYSNEFRRDLERLIKNAKDENLDACALSYVDLTLTCVKCHKHVREVRMTQLPRRVQDP
jgi:hypothetical protein